ncbi:UMP kinase [Patescibacteria group bacterium]|nr:UMP kinase [Patescibacteria group bacterium]MBU1663507.1 UMP kinase [Patescibacteria group bacterium]MBU1934002.1 UMP kinase [Patescibacteria group bacterium]MBU2008180.1 UMP kinase [Patescibacteria group bacterium]MBU2233910.1 UMP kinase [Patescibacteria group bacterium]
MKKPKYKRILLKISGEAMKGKQEYGIDPEYISYLSKEIESAHKTGVQIAIVVGAGNIFRGVAGSKHGLDRATADYMGMLATIFNAMALQDALEKLNLVTRLQTAVEMKQIAEMFIRRKALRHLEKGRIVILGGGTGLPFITTDTTAAMRGLELGCEAIFKATKVDGVYDDDPVENLKAKKFTTLTLDYAFQNDKIKIMDKSALSLCHANNIHIIIFKLSQKGDFKKAIMGEKIGTTIC